MSNSIVRWIDEHRPPALAQRPGALTPNSPHPPVATPARPSPWAAASRGAKRVVTWWLLSWVAITVVCVLVAQHRVPLTADAIAGAVLATLIVAAIESDRQAKAARQR